MNENELQTLVARTVHGDRVAFQALYESTSPTVFGVLQRMLSDRAQAEDVLQDTYVKVWSRAGEYHYERGRVIGWVIGIARNRALDILRAKKRRGEVQSADSWPPETIAGNSGELEQNTVLQQCMERLAAIQQQSIIGAFVHGWTHEELAKLLSLPVGTVKSRIRRGLALLKDCLER